jgi:hypothetical protein
LFNATQFIAVDTKSNATQLIWIYDAVSTGMKKITVEVWRYEA